MIDYMTKEIDLKELAPYFKALHCSIRWDIIEILKDSPKSSDEIFNILTESKNNKNDNNQECEGKCLNGRGRDIQKPTLYYHLRELESVGIIESEPKPSEQKRAPEKVWKLNMEKLTINLK